MKMTTENRLRVVTVRRVWVSRSSVLNSRTLCRMTDPKNSTSGGCVTSCRAVPTSGSERSGASKLMTSLSATGYPINFRLRVVSMTSLLVLFYFRSASERPDVELRQRVKTDDVTSGCRSSFQHPVGVDPLGEALYGVV